MSFSGSIKAGRPDFGIVHVDPKAVALMLQPFLDRGSKLTDEVTVDDISTRVLSVPDKPEKATLKDLLAIGMKYFDAVVWLSAKDKSGHPLRADPTMKTDDIPSNDDVAKSIFYCYFMLLTQAKYPPDDHVIKKIPRFLTILMGMNKEPSFYVSKICTFELRRMNPSWIKHVEFDLTKELLSRFGIYVAGYRMFVPFDLYDAREGLPDNLVSAFTFARTVARAPASWNVHPLTRPQGPQDAITRRGNLKNNLGNLILDVFTDEQIDEMIKHRIIFKRPDRDVAHREYLQWAAEDDISGTANIFPAEN
ncbi:hypothetical protein E4U57_006530 [Claviceps arundinis]|uniref:Uncharacterized protein n=1 Tax=Claviceps arundinis TaxID=1623583 RepID=A0A9P7MRB1_9HYPO|nr:hypothetical protein E4U57_006530 [Claviceps arundinis]KAG5964714.1 hypothetical protein E4U56_002105 [Claviceps arundinis]